MSDSLDANDPNRRRSAMSPDANRQMFDRIAGRYDLLNRITSLRLDRRWRRRAIRQLDPQPGEKYLDVGCGTGDMTVEILRQCDSAEVVGIDPAENMLALARAKTAAACMDGCTSFRPGDAMALQFDDATFAGAVTAFCIRNVACRPLALEEMHRVIAPGGRVVILELTVPANRLLRMGHRFYSRRIVPLAGRLIARDDRAYRYLVNSVEDFLLPSEMLKLMQSAGFTSNRHIGLLGGTASIFVGERG